MSVGVASCDDPLVSIMGYYLGNIFGACLYGALTVQLYRYYMSFPKDHKPFKVVIYIVYVMEMICTVFLIYDLGASIHSIYDHSVNLDPIDGSVTSTEAFSPIGCSSKFSTIRILGVCGGIVAFLTQSMYAYRIRIITKLKYMPWIFVLVTALQLFAIVTILSIDVAALITVMKIWTSMSLFVDVTITSIMVWFLKKDEIYCKQLKRKIARLIYLILGTGFLTAATNLGILVCSLSNSTSAYAFGLLIVLSKLYANSMMVLVNSRIPSARTEINHRVTWDMITVRLSSIRATSQAAANAEHGPREMSVDPEACSVGLSAHDAEDTPNNHDLGSLTV